MRNASGLLGLAARGLRFHWRLHLSVALGTAVAGTALVEASAIGLGATIAFLASGTAADATGLIAAGLVAALGLFILPNKRRQAKKDLAKKIAELRERLMQALTEQFNTAALASETRVRETVSPYTRFVSSERDRLEEHRTEVDDLGKRVAAMQAEIEEFSKS